MGGRSLFSVGAEWLERAAGAFWRTGLCYMGMGMDWQEDDREVSRANDCLRCFGRERACASGARSVSWGQEEQWNGSEA